MNKRVVISLHGIKTRGVWQKELAPELALGGLVPYVLDYGHLGAIELMRPSSLDKRVRWLVGEYDRIRADSGCERPSVIAHSFGTLQVAHLLRKHAEVIFDKVILAAGIVPTNFPWADLLAKERVMWVTNEYGGKDLWPKLARLVVPHAGSCGANQFADTHRALHQIRHPHHGHSDYFSQGHFRYHWLPTLLLDKRAIVDDLHYLTWSLSRQYGVNRERLRCFVLAEQPPTRGCLKLVHGLRVGDILPAEEDMVVRIDTLGPDAAPAVAFKYMREVRPTGADLEALRIELRRHAAIHPELKWSVALPIPSRHDMSKAVGALRLDGLEAAPGLLANALLEDENVFNILIRLGRALSPPSDTREE